MTGSLVLQVSNAAAQSSTAQAEALYRQGRDLLKAGKIEEACAAFEGSQKIEPATGTQLAIAACHEKNGKLATAWGDYVAIARDLRGKTDSKSTQAMHRAESQAAALEPRLSKLAITVSPSQQVPGLDVHRGTELVDPGAWNRALPVDGGDYVITASAPNMQPWSTTVTIASERDDKVVEITGLQPIVPAATASTDAPASSATDAPPAEQPSKGLVAPVPRPPEARDFAARPTPAAESTEQRHWLGPVLAGGGAVLLFGSAYGVLKWGDATYDDAKAETSSQMRRDSLYDSANTKRSVSLGLAIGGGLSAAVAVWLLLRERDDEPATSHPHSLIVTPTGFAFEGSF